MTAPTPEPTDKWATRGLYALDADVTLYWPDVRPDYDWMGEADAVRPVAARFAVLTFEGLAVTDLPTPEPPFVHPLSSLTEPAETSAAKFARAVRASDRAELERLCEVMHDAYEAAAVGAGWETQAASRMPWSDVPEPNKATMRAAVLAVLAAAVPVLERELRDKIADEIAQHRAKVDRVNGLTGMGARSAFFAAESIVLAAVPLLPQETRMCECGGELIECPCGDRCCVYCGCRTESQPEAEVSPE